MRGPLLALAAFALSAAADSTLTKTPSIGVSLSWEFLCSVGAFEISAGATRVITAGG